MEKIRRIEAKNYDQYRDMKFKTIANEDILVSRIDNENRRIFQCVKSPSDISTDDMIQVIFNYLHTTGFDEYERQGKLLISGQVNGKNYELQSNEISYI